ncbi:trypsin-like peptidase domain-containing protein [Streptantibioticus parmotrematis]|uniref:S1C family serine protease n=1 Tax=Streptantibioticus parmotrematis TaxID=2873249 RepID=UPI0033CA7F60
MNDGKPARPRWWTRPRKDRPAPAAPHTAPPAHGPSRAPGTTPASPERSNAAAPPYAPVPPPPHDPPPQPGAGAVWHRYDPWAPPGQAALPPPPAPTRGPGRRRLLTGAVLLALAAGLAGGLTGAALRGDGGGDSGTVSLPQIPTGGSGQTAPGAVARIAAAALPGVVYIHVKGDGVEGTGTGIVLDTAGHILTNNHVVAPAATSGDISVTFNGGVTRKAAITGRDTGYDLAVVKVDGVSGLRPLTLGDSSAVRIGDPVVAIGAPYDLEGTVTSGIISAKDRAITAGGEGGAGSDVSYMDALQTDAPINPGNSGGPLMNARGQVIGVNSAIRSADNGSGADGSQGGSIGLGFAIPSDEARRVAQQLIDHGHAVHPVIGVTVDMRYTGDGARIAATGPSGAPAVTPGGPGAAAGLKSGDVVTAVDGKPVHTGEDLIVRTRDYRPGERVALSVLRGGHRLTLDLVLGGASGG